MIRLYFAAGAAAVVIAGAALMYQRGKDAAGNEARENTIEREGKINDAINSCSGLPWHERLFCAD